MVFFAPKTTDFVHLLKEITNDISGMAGLFEQFVAKFGNNEDILAMAKDLEHQADAKVHNIICELNKTFITPFDREDIYALSHQLDDIADLIENVMINIHLFDIKEKNAVLDSFKVLINDAAKALNEAITALEDKKLTMIGDKLVAIHKLEDEGDLAFADAMKKLFREEKDPINLIKWKQIIEDLESIMDKFQEVSNIIEGIVVKAS
ncbi:DUF47 domain-containing protein [Candidatus Gracilibacteria bacterium]|jgi:predicted phosphate transport protein (TIGR00153 family)|nr:DUF47 domain-containing protein [Candidatus Gracilibacteria bacterium]